MYSGVRLTFLVVTGNMYACTTWLWSYESDPTKANQIFKILIYVRIESDIHIRVYSSSELTYVSWTEIGSYQVLFDLGSLPYDR